MLLALVLASGEGFCFLAVIGSLAAMREIGRRPRAATGSTVEQIKEGVGFVVRSKPVGALLLLLGIVSVMGMPLHVGASGLGVPRLPRLRPVARDMILALRE